MNTARAPDPYSDEIDEVWLAPYRSGMLRIAAKISHVGPQESAIIEMLSSGEVVTPAALADCLWPGKWPKDHRQLIEHRIVRVRKMLPADYIMTVYNKHARLLGFFGRHAFSPLVGWQLTGKIHVQ